MGNAAVPLLAANDVNADVGCGFDVGWDGNHCALAAGTA